MVVKEGPKTDSRGRKVAKRAMSRGYGRQTHLSCVFVALCLLFLMSNSQIQCAATLVNHIVEVQATSLPILTEGVLRYLPDLKPTGSSIPGIFMHMKKAPSASDGNVGCQLFDASPEPSFPRTAPLEIPVLTGTTFVRANYDASTGWLYLESTIGALIGGIHGAAITFDSATNSFKSGPRTVLKAPESESVRRIMITEDKTSRYFFVSFAGAGTGYTRMVSIAGAVPTFSVNADLIADTPGNGMIDKVIRIGKYQVFFNPLGYIHIDDDTIQNQTVDALVTKAPDFFKPLFATKDVSVGCSVTGCQAIVYEVRANTRHFLSMIGFVLDPTIIVNYKFPEFETTDFGVPGMPFQLPNQKFVVLAGATQFYMFKILDDKFEAFTDFKGPTYTGLVSGSVAVGAYDSSTYPNSMPVMMMFQDGPNFKAKMFAFQQVQCSSKDADGYCNTPPDGFGLNTLKVITKCRAVGCLKCITNLDQCELCGEGYLLYQKMCYKCEGIAKGAIYLQPSGSSCVDPGAALFSSGHGSFIQEGVNVLQKCTASNCLTCNSDVSKCSSCISTFQLYDGICTLCVDATSQALLVGVGNPQCVLKADPQYANGYGMKTETPFPIIHKCSVENCKICNVTADSCTKCSFGYQASQEGSRKTCSKSPSPIVKVYRQLDRNSLELFFPDTESRHIEQFFVNDLNNRKTYTCAETGCSYSWRDSMLTVTFNTNIQITSGELRITRTSSAGAKAVTPFESKSKGNRRLQLNELDIVIPNIMLMGNSWFPVCITILKILVLLSRTVMSLLLFWKYPILAMAADYLVTGCLVLFIVQGPILKSAELFFQTISSVKLPWYQLPNIFRNWDSQTLFTDTLPNHREHGVLNSFLDNYGVNAVSFCGLAVILFVVHALCVWLLNTKRVTGKTAAIASRVVDCYGWKYFLAKLQANSLEILIYTVISFAKADASSKSIIGIVLAGASLISLVWITIGTSLWINETHLKKVVQQQQQQPDQAVLRIQTEEAQLQADPSVGSPVQAHEPGTNWRTRVLYSRVGGFFFNHQLFKYSVMNMKQFDTIWRGFTPAAALIRDIAFAVLVLNHIQSSLVQLMIMTCIQAGYLAYFLASHHSSQLYELTVTLVLQFFILCSLILKAVSTSTGLSDSALQNGIGPVIGILGVIIMFVSLGFQVLALFRCFSSETTVSVRQTQIETVPQQEVVKITHGDNNLQLDMSVWPQRQQTQDIADLDLQIPEENPSHAKEKDMENQEEVPKEVLNILEGFPVNMDPTFGEVAEEGACAGVSVSLTPAGMQLVDRQNTQPTVGL